MKTKIILFALCLVTIAGCYYDNEEELYNCTINAGSTNYSVISTILSSYGCTGCHGRIGSSGGYDLSTYEGVKARGADGKLMGSITHAPGFKPMPQGGAKMNGCDIKKVKAWIDAGMPQ